MAGLSRLGFMSRWTASALILSTVVSAQLPYIPTTVLLPPPDKKGGPIDTAYIFTTGGGDNTVELLSLNLSSLTTSVLSTPPVTGAFTPTIFANGTLGIFAGDCSSQSDGSLWTWSPDPDSTTSPKWHPHPQPSLAPFHLGGSISFSLQLSPVISPSTLYLYGGMCPFTNLSEAIPYDSQQASASYSNSMFRLPLSQSSSTSQGGEYLSSPGPPIPNAGFTLTALQPSLSNRTTADGVKALTQQNGWALLGGHTQQAFINMSTAAVWSLPEETWSFIPIHGDKQVDSRSGHTTVLSEDGTKLVIYGGWVGDVGQKAEPEVVVVDMGLGGLEDWSWLEEEIESVDGGGRYGHGAVVLPGDVMAVYGGWAINGVEGEKKKRQDGDVMGLKFLDLKKMQWVDEYTLPKSSSGGVGGGQADGGSGNDGADDGKQQEDDSTKKTQIGLGVGLGVGSLILFLVIGAILYRRRQQTRSRNDALRDLSQGINGSLPRGITSDHNDDEMLERDHGLMFPWTAASAREWYIGGDDPYSQGRKSLAYEGLRGGIRKTGGSLYMPPPPPSARNARGLYQPTNKTTSYEFAPGGGAGRSNLISPIYEADEDDEGDLGQQSRHNIGRVSPEKPPQDSSEDDDPFLTPTTATTPISGLFPPPSISSRSASSPSPERKPPQAQDPEVQNWQNDVDVADAVLTARIGRRKSIASKTPPRPYLGQQSGSIPRSPTKGPDTPTHADERTGSNLSETSAFSFVPGAERQPLRVNTAAANNGDVKPSSSGSGGSSSSAPTFSTARSSFPALQSEGPGLLLGQTTQQQADTYDDGQGGYEIYNYDGYKDEEDADYVYVPGSPSKSKPPQRRSWLGSIRRVFEKGTPESSATGGSREDLNLAGQLESGTGVDTGLGGVMRQGTLQRRKQNRQLWGGEGEGEGDWDIERAVEQRLVQVMFTVPKEKLRVVNAEIEQEGEVGEVVREGDRDFDGGYYDTWDGPPTPRQQQQKGKLPEIELLPPPRGEEEEKDGDDMDRKRESIAGSILTTNTMGISPSTSLRQAEIKTEGLHTAEAVRYERLEVNPGVSLSPTTMTPERVMRLKKSRTRVLEMVESIESKSSRSSLREGSEEEETPKKV
ncbi:hypothetical protein QBC40DRAFT_227902 [Triangularia verruculosa]|uniref:Galactose oxidase n=1 Tax=Triangularia verruculosa TaxID=2587418 RepID=A0AAN6XKH2_9PEZI|nr:hypothetical protein QBC40DRAFT_227902 [Triangularia verruculosa]